MEMLNVAKSENLYVNYYHEALLEDKTSGMIPLNSYDLVVAVGVFGRAHLTEKHLKRFIEFAKVTRSFDFRVFN